ncbi:dihydroorotase [Halobaculum sp. MBLA0143]|uniref:dihydroorotase n=1 Tax=Halobaculum sp. MBLA0143 TaxID=3079933 RepID=UPI0035256047
MLFTAASLADGRTRDVRVTDGEITAVAESLDADTGETVIDAAGRHLLPGAVDVHVHFREPGFSHKETWATGSRAAAAGGVTTVVDQPNTTPPTTTGAAFDEKAGLARESLVDYGVNGGVTADWDPESLFDRPVFALGEVFLADSTGEMGIETELFEGALARASEAGVPVTVHAEDATQFESAALDEAGDGVGRAAPVDRWSRYRPAAAEVAAVETALASAATADSQVHVAHTSTPEAVDAVAAADRAADDRRVTCEVTPHHLLLSRDDGERLGTYGRMNPPLRSESRREALYERVRDGTVDVIATDHAPHTTTEKEATLAEAPSGVPGVETMLPLLLGEVTADRLSLERVRDLVAANPAEIFGLPRKGTVAPGTDADLVLVDLDATEPVRGDRRHTDCGWTPFEGRTAVFPELTLVRGSVVYDGRDGETFGDAVGRNVRAAD